MTSTFRGMGAEEARRFAERWLPAWTGGDAEALCAFYAAEATYADPFVRDGLVGLDAIRPYFARLLAANPRWVWTHTGSTPLEHGFLNRWHAAIPVGDEVVECTGVCTVQLDDHGLIGRNEVFFDPSPWHAARARQASTPAS